MGILRRIFKSSNAIQWLEMNEVEQENLILEEARSHIEKSMGELHAIDEKLYGNANLLRDSSLVSAIEQRLTWMKQNGEAKNLAGQITKAYKRGRASRPWDQLVHIAVSTYFQELEKLKMKGVW